MTVKPSDMPLRRLDMPPCNTPEKMQFRSKAAALRWWRNYYVPDFFDDKKSAKRPYLCQCGEHWHLTSQEQRKHDD